MTLFDWHTVNYPKTWSDMSFDFRLMFVWHGSMMALMVIGTAVSISTAFILGGLLAGSLMLLSIQHRRGLGWRWPGAGVGDVASAVFSAIAVAFFIYAATPLFPPVNVPTIAWYLAGAGVGAFSILLALNLTRMAKADFLADCGTRREPSPALAIAAHLEPRCQRAVRIVFTVIFLLVWVEGVASFYFFGVAFRSGAPTATAEKSERLQDHGAVVYVTLAEKGLIDRLETGEMIGIPAVLACGALIHFVMGIKLFPNVPVLRKRN